MNSLGSNDPSLGCSSVKRMNSLLAPAFQTHLRQPHTFCNWSFWVVSQTWWCKTCFKNTNYFQYYLISQIYGRNRVVMATSFTPWCKTKIHGSQWKQGRHSSQGVNEVMGLSYITCSVLRPVSGGASWNRGRSHCTHLKPGGCCGFPSAYSGDRAWDWKTRPIPGWHSTPLCPFPQQSKRPSGRWMTLWISGAPWEANTTYGIKSGSWPASSLPCRP